MIADPKDLCACPDCENARAPRAVLVPRYDSIHEVRSGHPTAVQDPRGVFFLVADVRRALRAAGVDPGSVGL